MLSWLKVKVPHYREGRAGLGTDSWGACLTAHTVAYHLLLRLGARGACLLNSKLKRRPVEKCLVLIQYVPTDESIVFVARRRWCEDNEVTEDNSEES